MDLKKRKIMPVLLLSLLSILFLGISTGLIIINITNSKISEILLKFKPEIPSELYDCRGGLITKYAVQDRKLISLDELPPHLFYALFAREDTDFYKHHGYDVSQIIRAGIHKYIIRDYSSGGSTITQQLVGILKLVDRNKKTLLRKAKEVIFAIQLENRLTKKEILELYLNNVNFGHNTYGVEAASRFYFHHSSRDITLAESAILISILSSPNNNSPIRNPSKSKKISWTTLKRMIKLGFVDYHTARESYDDYWEDEYDPTRYATVNSSSRTKIDRAPYFSEYIRRRLEKLGKFDYYRDGLKIYTSLDPGYQKIAETTIRKTLLKLNNGRGGKNGRQIEEFESDIVPVIDMLSLSFNIKELKFDNLILKRKSELLFFENINPHLDIYSQLFNLKKLKGLTKRAFSKKNILDTKNNIEGALITIENKTGYIRAMIGGSNPYISEINRSTRRFIQPGSAFKPLYYCEAIASRKFSTASLINDSPIKFYYEDSKEYIPENYFGIYKGPVRLRYALSHSMNIPSLVILDRIGFEAAITMSSRLLGMSEYKDDAKVFPRVYPFGLGVISVSPLDMARAYSVFANLGEEIEPTGILYIEDRDGNIIYDAREERRKKLKPVLSPQEAYIMISLLESTIKDGTLRNAGKLKDISIAGKTGTTQNWSNAWTIGFSPYLTTAVWFGFDIPGNSLGVKNTGAGLAGPVWMNYMKKIHRGFLPEKFTKPRTGLVECRICKKSGLLFSDSCPGEPLTEIFLEGTEPVSECNHSLFKKSEDQKGGQDSFEGNAIKKESLIPDSLLN